MATIVDPVFVDFDVTCADEVGVVGREEEGEEEGADGCKALHDFDVMFC